MVFTTEGLFEVAIESWPEWDYIYINVYLKISLREYNLYRNRNNQNQETYMRSENQRCKIVTLLKSLKNIVRTFVW